MTDRSAVDDLGDRTSAHDSDPVGTSDPVHRPAAGRSATRIMALRHGQPRRRATTSAAAAWPRDPRAHPARVAGCDAIGAATSVMFVATAVDVLSVGLPDPRQARAADVRPADGRLRPDRRGGARPLPARGAPGRRVRRRAAAGPRRDDHRRGPDVLGQRRVRRRRRSSRPSPKAPAATRERGASTITQQLVRARLLPAEVTAAGADRYMRKAKEIIQVDAAVRATFPGESGKERIITAYLNEIFYGHGAYGIAAAACDLLRRLRPRRADARPGGAARRPAQVALDARPVPVRGQGRRGPAGRAARRAAGRPPRLDPRTGSPTAPLDEPDADRARGGAGRARRPRRRPAATIKAAHFTWQVRRQLEAILGGAEAVETGGYTVITTLDMEGAGARREVARPPARSSPTSRARRARRC